MLDRAQLTRLSLTLARRSLLHRAQLHSVSRRQREMNKNSEIEAATSLRRQKKTPLSLILFTSLMRTLVHP